MNPQTTTRPALVRFALWRVPTGFAAKAWEAASLAIMMALVIANAVFDMSQVYRIRGPLPARIALVRVRDQVDGPERRLGPTAPQLLD